MCLRRLAGGVGWPRDPLGADIQAMSFPRDPCLSYLDFLCHPWCPSGDGLKTWSQATAGISPQFSIPSTSVYRFQRGTKITQGPDCDIGATASYPNFVPALLYPYAQNTSWDHLFLLELSESLWKVVLLSVGICEATSHVPGPGAQWWPKPWNERSHPSQRL